MGSWGRFFAVGVGVAMLGIVASCANGSTYEGSGDDGGDDGSSVATDGQSSGGGDGTTHTDGGSGTCTGSETSCKGVCVNTTNDPNNCGSCGKVCGAGLLCSNSACATACSDSQDGGGQLTECTSPDGGTPFCSNLQTDPANCGACGKSCGTNHACQAGTCILSCPPSQSECVSGDTCIPIGACCTTNDCTIAGETCATPGSTCSCPGGQKACGANNQCIVSTTCCTNTDCSISGQTCSGPGGTCTCPTGQTGCATSGTCIPAGNCCTNADCTVTGETCGTPGGTCACATGYTACVGNNACIASTACCDNTDCTVTGETCSAPGGSCGCGAGNKVCTPSNSCIPTNTCCTSNDCLVTGETCTGPGGNCTCPNGGSVCLANNSCIPPGSCCTNADCPGGGLCSGPGGSCNCPTGNTFCTTNNACIPTTSCCPATGCTITGETCSGPAGTCSCSVAGDVVCGNLCIPGTTCCNNASCLPLPPNATGGTCAAPGDACKYTCTSTCSSLGGNCNCCEDGNLTCGGNVGGQNLGSLNAPGASGSGSGTLPGSTPDWFQVTFEPGVNTTAHPQIIVSVPNGAPGPVLFDLYTDCSGDGSPACGEGGNCVGKVSWDTAYTCQTGTTPCIPGDLGFLPIKPVTYYIKVYRPVTSGTPATCADATFTIDATM